MSDSEARLIEAAFALSAGLMLISIGLRGLALRKSSALREHGKVHPPGVVAIDLVGVALLGSVYFGFHWMSTGVPREEMAAGLTPAGLVMSIASQGAILAMVVGLVLPRGQVAEFFGLRWKKWPWILLIAPVAVVFVWGLIALLEMVGYSRWMAEHFGGPQLQESVSLLRQSEDPVTLALMGVAAVLAAPLCEECVFRGYIYPVVKKFGGAGGAAIASALLFAAAHNHAQTLVPLFLLGLVLVWVYELTGSIWAPIGLHLCFNGLTVGLTLVVRLLGLPMEVPS
jgi:membrane protease YdiL (CAAX protease family)